MLSLFTLWRLYTSIIRSKIRSHHYSMLWVNKCSTEIKDPLLHSTSSSWIITQRNAIFLSNLNFTNIRRIALSFATTVFFVGNPLINRRMLCLYFRPRWRHSLSRVTRSTPGSSICWNTKGSRSRRGGLATIVCRWKPLNEIWVDWDASRASTSSTLWQRT